MINAIFSPASDRKSSMKKNYYEMRMNSGPNLEKSQDSIYEDASSVKGIEIYMPL
jgi:hypothetical protein